MGALRSHAGSGMHASFDRLSSSPRARPFSAPFKQLPCFQTKMHEGKEMKSEWSHPKSSAAAPQCWFHVPVGSKPIYLPRPGTPLDPTCTTRWLVIPERPARDMKRKLFLGTALLRHLACSCNNSATFMLFPLCLPPLLSLPLPDFELRNDLARQGQCLGADSDTGPELLPLMPAASRKT